MDVARFYFRDIFFFCIVVHTRIAINSNYQRTNETYFEELLLSSYYIIVESKVRQSSNIITIYLAMEIRRKTFTQLLGSKTDNDKHIKLRNHNIIKYNMII